MTIDDERDRQLDAPQRAGDCALPLSEAACAALVTVHGPMVKAVCQRILGDPALAEDAAQEVFLLLVRKLPSLAPATLLGGWLYVTACHLARTQQRAHLRRSHRENRAMEYLMKPAEDTLWGELEPLLDNAILTLSDRQRELVLSRYFQNKTQRAAASLVGCSESVASRELSAAIEHLRRFFSKRGVTVSATALATLLTTRGAEASIGTATIATTLSSASTLAGTSTAGTLLFALMKTTTATKVVVAAAAALLFATGTIRYATRDRVQTSQSKSDEQPTSGSPADNRSRVSDIAGSRRISSTPGLRTSPTTTTAKITPTYDETALKAASEKQKRFFERMGQFALMDDPLKVQELLKSEYGIQLSVDEIRRLQRGGQKGFTLGMLQLWPSKQPHEALAWAASVFSGPIGPGVDVHQSLLDSARKALPNLNRDTLEAMVPEGAGKAKMLDLIEAATDPHSLANRILAVADPAERTSRLKLLAQGWSNSEISAAWARENLTGADRITFYKQVGYNLAEQNPQAALQVLAELQGTDAYTSTFMAMMRGLVQEGGQGQRAAELITKSDLNPTQRTDLISELARRWVRSDADAAIAWANTLTAPEDFRAAIPLLVSQLENDRVSRTVEAHLKNLDPVMELGLIEAAAPTSLVFDPQKARLILDPLIGRDPACQLRSGEGSDLTRDQMLWNSVNLTARRQAEAGQPAAAMEWLATLPFAAPSDYSKVVGNVLTVWNLKSPADASGWLQNSSLNPTVKADLSKFVHP